ncbi:hypothetical protein C8R44DRAFT_826035, partial [Mycena epipterygia]
EARAVRPHFRPRGHVYSPIRARGADAGRWSGLYYLYYTHARYRSTYTETSTPPARKSGRELILGGRHSWSGSAQWSAGADLPVPGLCRAPA